MNKKQNKVKKNQTKYKVRRIGLILILALILVLILLSAKNTNNITKLSSQENALEIGGQKIDISGISSIIEVNPPCIGAGMIPIKWDGSYWVITDQKDWYDYSTGKFANVMLSDRIL